MFRKRKYKVLFRCGKIEETRIIKARNKANALTEARKFLVVGMRPVRILEVEK